jgi:O-Antigen ligase
LIGADRIDLLAGHGPFILTPFLVLAPLVLLISLLRGGPHGLFHLTILPPMRRQIPFVAAASLFLLFTFGSILLSLDPERSIVAFADLLLVTFLGYCISVQILAGSAQDALIARSVTFALVMYVLFCIAECIAWTHGLYINAERTGSWVQSTFAPSSLGPWAPVLSGTTFDANRSGFVLMMYLVLVDRFAPKWRYARICRFVITVLIFLTFSRSATLCWLAYYLFSKSFWRHVRSRRVIIRAAAIIVAGSFLCVAYEKEILAMAEVWEISDAVSAKLSMEQGSSGESHILLIQRGVKAWLTSTKTIVAGIGFAAAPKVLGDFFGTDKHGNFHCLYVTALAEMGVPAFCLLMLVLVYPIIGRTGALPGIAAVMVFNISYQTHMEPVFWLILALSWSCGRGAAHLGFALLSPPSLRLGRNAASLHDSV